MIETLLTCSVILNIITISYILLYDGNITDLKVKNYQLKCQNLILEREYEKLRDFIKDLRDERVEVDWDNDKYIILYEPKTDDFKKFFTDLWVCQDD